eukprot:TRINITY_DN52294_c0_g2_i1.p1 TRINITY_DN52294_c0_g2~~TRINITY_DN52294_c0_g2_i1.p1  ORF type:complete len:161 (-),score=55.54 TRINITY_DN52294_c0_g2_i1:46-528(-)
MDGTRNEVAVQPPKPPYRTLINTSAPVTANTLEAVKLRARVSSSRDGNLTLIPHNIGCYLCVAYQSGFSFYREASLDNDLVTAFNMADQDFATVDAPEEEERCCSCCFGKKSYESKYEPFQDREPVQPAVVQEMHSKVEGDDDEVVLEMDMKQDLSLIHI